MTAGRNFLSWRLHVFNERPLFPADGVNGNELWRTDGTAGGPVLVKGINAATASPDGFTVFSGALYFRADDGANGYEFWKTDGTAAGTERW